MLWEIHTEAIIDVRFRYADTETHNTNLMDTLFLRLGKIIRTSTGSTAMTTGNKSQFVLSVDGIMGKESQIVFVTLSQIMAAKMEKPILHVKGWVKSRVAIAVGGSYSRMLR